MDFKASVSEIVKLVGGKENIKNMTHCVTRLRFVVADDSKVEMDKIKSVEGVINVIKSSGQYQVVVGTNVNKMYDAAVELVGPMSAPAKADTVKEKKTVKGALKHCLDVLIACFVPYIPVIAGAGMIKVLAVLLNTAGVLTTDSTTYIFLNGIIGDGVFYFLPFFVSYSCAKKIGTNPFTAMALAAIIMHPSFLALAGAEVPVTFIGIPVQVLNYSAQAIPMILGVVLLKYVDKFAEKVSPSIVSIFLRSMIDLLIVAPIMFFVLGPISMALNDAIFAACTAMMSWGWLAVGINALLFPLMVLTGTHNASIPLIIQFFATQGFDPIFLVSGLAVNIAQAGAACAVATKTKNKALRSTGISATVSALLGITEPALYGVNLRMKKPFIGMMLGAFVGGCFCGIIGLAAPAFATPSLITCAIFVPAGRNIILGFLAVAVSFAAAFIFTRLLGFKDLPAEEN